MGENTKQDRSPLLPLRHAQGDFFVCDIFDAIPKADMASMEHPIFTLSTKPDLKIRRYERNNLWAEIAPSAKGLATVHDRDILIYCISQVIAAMNNGSKVYRTLRFKAYDLLVATNRGTDGRGYEQLKAALERLRGTTISTNITTGGVEQLDVFGLIDRARVVRESRDGRMIDVEITLSDWVFNAIEQNDVLTLNKQYFQLRKPLERRLYEIIRKQCGRKSETRINLSTLHEKTGSTSASHEFKRLIQNIIKDDIEHNHMPDFSIRLENQTLIARPKQDYQRVYTGKNVRIDETKTKPTLQAI
ncbi:MAG: replication initiator protein A, partial [Cyanobacteria bacterium J06649_11]